LNLTHQLICNFSKGFAVPIQTFQFADTLIFSVVSVENVRATHVAAELNPEIVDVSPNPEYAVLAPAALKYSTYQLLDELPGLNCKNPFAQLDAFITPHTSSI
jgi:hypothetical protein